jgi:RAD50-interacting protein 1
LQDAQRTLADIEREATEQAVSLQQKAVSFQKHQDSIDKQLQEITYSSTTNDAVRVFGSRMQQLQRLEIATNYIEVVHKLDRLRAEALQKSVTSPRAAVTSFNHLHHLASKLSQAQTAAEGAASQLVLKADAVDKDVHIHLKDSITKSFTKVLERMGWPKKDMNLLGDVLSTWAEQAGLLLELQDAESTQARTRGDVPVVLLPVETMIAPLAQRFRYHFYGERPTNRLDKPEYFLSHVLDLLDRQSEFIQEELQAVLDHRTEASGTVEEVYPDAISAFITGLLPMAVNKCLSLLPNIVSQPQLLSHLMNELMSFDDIIRESWNYNPVPGTFSSWKGLTWVVLDQHGYFEQWLKTEKDFALARYRTIRDASDSGDIDYEGVDSNQTKPTKGTIRVNDLLETITHRYRRLMSFSQKMKFVIGIQISIFDDYHAHLHGSLQAYLASSHTAGRLLQGQYSKHEAFDERALATLCKVYGSAEYLERKMADWSDDVFFLELWEELQERASMNSGSNATIGKDLRIDEVASKTSTTIRPGEVSNSYEADSGGLFDETARAYRRLKDSAENEIGRLLDINIREAVAAYARVDSWTSMSSATVSTDPSPSVALERLLQVTLVLIGFLSKVFARTALRRVVRHHCNTIQREILATVVLAHDFSAAGVAQLRRDLVAIEDAIDASCGMPGTATPGFRKLDEAIHLLGLPIKPSSGHLEFESATDDSDGWGFEEDNEDTESVGKEAALTTSSSQDRVWSLWEAEKEIFRSNDAARQALSDMGLSLLNEQEARNLLKRRIEINS